MHNILPKSIIPLLVLIVLLAGCATKKAGPAIAPSLGGTVITIEAGSYSFKPTTLRVGKPGPYVLQVINTTGSKNNLTLKDPRGNVIKAVDIPPKETTISNIDLPVAGAYEFFSDKRFRASMGMKGKIVVGASE
ncbi:MAG: cupredoxin domain-containing protein [Syntrophobacter sp.]